VVKVFELAIVRTGLQEEQPRNAGSDPRTDQSAFLDNKAHYRGAQEIVFRICGDKSTGQLLGAQLIGHWKSEISQRVDIFGTALLHKRAMERRAASVSRSAKNSRDAALL
jgi:pyruvate/2-oxoglutarate dehydrogenase complex dihydrolipoamide dehydrogenase (E3) component